MHSGLNLICSQHTSRHCVAVPQFWCDSYFYIFHLKGKYSSSLVFYPSKYEFRWKIWLGCDFGVTSVCFHTSAVEFASSRRSFLICVYLKVSGPQCVSYAISPYLLFVLFNKTTCFLGKNLYWMKLMRDFFWYQRGTLWFCDLELKKFSNL